MAGRRRRDGSTRKGEAAGRVASGIRTLWRWTLRGIGAAALAMVLTMALFAYVNPPWGLYILGEYRRIGSIERTWVPMSEISPHMARAAVAAEDANFCLHWGFDMNEIRRALEADARRGASTITQQTVKNVFLWHGRSWFRKALEAGMTPMVEVFWSKRRILEVYLNVAEFGDGVFGVEAAARRHFNVSAAALTLRQSARLAAILPDPRNRNPNRLSPFLQRRAAMIEDGAATILRDGRSACFED